MEVTSTGFIKYNRKDVTQELLKNIFEYRDGNIYWKISNNTRTKIGSKAGTDTCGYTVTIFHGLRMKNHQIIFLMEYGYLPKLIDHADRNGLNNLKDNLRDGTFRKNAQNRGIRSDNKSGYKGVHYHKLVGKWVAEICIDGVDEVLGYFLCPKEAAKAYNKSALLHFKEFAYLNTI